MSETKKICEQTGKVIYTSQKVAGAVLNQMKKRPKGRAYRFRNGDRPKRSYRCEHCQGWHLTHNNEFNY